MIVQAAEMKRYVNQRTGEMGFHIKQPHRLFDHIKEFYKVSSDSAIAHMLNTSPSVISRIRNGQMRMTPALVLATYDATKMPIETIRGML